jgi:drug/metabolite transporter (DMT)-like permease
MAPDADPPAAARSPRARLVLLTCAAMLAFAANSVLCRLALRHTQIDAASFTFIRLASGALALWLLVRRPGPSGAAGGSWLSALALFVYAATFSFAYTRLPAGVGALLLFGTVQTTMVGYGVWRGERPTRLQAFGMLVALGGLALLMWPTATRSAPSAVAALLMLVAGVGWGAYSLRGRSSTDAQAATRGNFLRSVPMAAVLLLAALASLRFDLQGVLIAMASGALASGGGYVIWYSVTPRLQSSQAATVQLSVPLLAAVAGVVLLGETMSAPQLLAGACILGGIWLSLRYARPTAR